MSFEITINKITFLSHTKIFIIFLVLNMIHFIGIAKDIHHTGIYLKVEYSPSIDKGELQIGVTYTLWIPEGVKTIRGIIVHQHGAGTKAADQGSTAAYDLHWQSLAKKWDCALLGPSYHVLNEEVDLTPGGAELWFDPRLGSEKVFLIALNEFAKKSGHLEIKTVPWILWGHSGGGIWSDVMACLHPERIVAIWLRSGSAAIFRSKVEFSQPTIPQAVYRIPIMCNAGVKEKDKSPWIGTLATFQEYRSKGAPIGFAPDPRTGHECGDSRYLAIPFLDACMAMRLPDKGSKSQKLKPIDMKKAWFASLDDNHPLPASKYRGVLNEAIWLPNEVVAKYWEEYVKTGAVKDNTPPPPPFDLQILSINGQSNELTWNADADFESGIRCFIVLRDGKKIAQIPESPFGKYGRPLFQSMSHGDTPTQPMHEMRYIDNSPDVGKNHKYAIISVNSLGLKSKPLVCSFTNKLHTHLIRQVIYEK